MGDLKAGGASDAEQAVIADQVVDGVFEHRPQQGGQDSGGADEVPGAGDRDCAIEITSNGGDSTVVLAQIGLIVDPGSDAPPSDTPDDDTGGGGGGGCFIASAAYGTPMAAEIDELRRVRDGYLLPNAFGAVFTDSYYRISPPIADFVAQHEWARWCVQGILTPVIFLARTGLAGWVSLGLLVSMAFFVRVGFGQRGRREEEV